jgi:ribosomal protein S18 acetylase RimI-like enzyme
MPRRAEVADTRELVRLRKMMLEAFGLDAGCPDAEWLTVTQDLFTRQLASDGRDFAAYVIGGGPGERLVACGLAWLGKRLPSPRTPLAFQGYIAGMSTEPEFRGRGYGRSILLQLLAWLKEQGAATVELHASSDGIGLYRSVGFQELSYPVMRMRL